MKSYQYVARDTGGSRKEGLTQALTANDVLGWLREQGFTPISINEIPLALQRRRTSYRKHIKSADLAALSWQLTTMLEGGIPITTALDTIAEDIENTQLKYVLVNVSEKVKRGQPFSVGIAEFPKVFNPLCRAIILSGETSGNLAEATKKLAMYFDSRDKLAKKIKGATAYPIFVCCFIVFIVIVIMTFIIPRFRAVFEQLGGQLPAFTRGFMAVYDWIVHNVVFIVGSFFLLIVAVILISRTKKGHRAFSRIMLSVPMFGKLFRQAFVATLCKTMATLLEAGVSVLEVFDILYEMTANDIAKSAIIQTRDHVVGGSNISLSMAATGFYPNMMIKMVQVGEESGSLPAVLERTSEHYERKVDSTISTMMTLIEPVLIITIGAIVLCVLLAMYLPIFTMSGAVGAAK
jgi:type IV pilus assembly protein PilC